MTHSLIISSLLMLLVSIGLWSLNGSIIIISLPLLFLLGIAYFYRPSSIRVQVKRRILTDQLIHEGTLKVCVEVTNEGSSLEEIVLEDLFPSRFELAGGECRILCSLDSGERIAWEYELKAYRGEYRFAGVSVSVRSHLGLFEKHFFITEETTVTVKPKTQILKKVDIRPRRTQVYTGSNPTRIGGSGIDYYGMRDYVAGDSPRLINWKALARHQDQLFANEFEQERMANIGLVFDCRKSSYQVADPRGFLDEIAPAAVELANALIRDGNRVGLLVYGAFLDWTFIGSGKAHREKIARAIAKIELKDHDVFENLGRIPTRLFPSQSQLIIFSPLQKNDYQPIIQLQTRGYQIIIISPNPVQFDKAGIENNESAILAERILALERELMKKKLIQSGIQIIDWDVSIPFYQIVSRHLNQRSIRNIDQFKAV